MIRPCTKRRRKSSLAPFGTRQRVRGNKNLSPRSHAAQRHPKNITELYTTAGGIGTAYTYTPYGAVSTTSNTAKLTQPIQWSSEYHDSELGLVYYKTADGRKAGWTCVGRHAPQRGEDSMWRVRINYRYYNPVDGRWTRRDPLRTIQFSNLYYYSKRPIDKIDIMGMYVVLCFSYKTNSLASPYGVIQGLDVITKDDIYIINVFSGNGHDANNANSQNIPNHGPIPEGVYWIEKMVDTRGSAGHGDTYPQGDWDWYPLWGNDKNENKSYESIALKQPGSQEFLRDKTGKVCTRGGFNIHTGLASDGCVTVKSTQSRGVGNFTNPKYPSSGQYNELKDFFE